MCVYTYIVKRYTKRKSFRTLQESHAHTCTYMYTCICVCVYIHSKEIYQRKKLPHLAGIVNEPELAGSNPYTTIIKNAVEVGERYGHSSAPQKNQISRRFSTCIY